jgi:rhamnose utilization protein RhaD (predicted bifunctional aldolase and dehydrogenase)
MPEDVSWKPELDALRAASARIGSDPLLTQGAGGNTSLKVGGVLWIKASGTWLAHALDRDIMVPVEFEPLLEAVAAVDPVAEQAHKFIVAARNASGLRPSIETTVHALMPQRVVLHVHCVDTIALAVRTDCVAQVAPRLNGLNWAYVPYARPGLPLALAIAKHDAQRPDVLILANHGLVVAGETVAAAEALLREVKKRLHAEPRKIDLAAAESVRELASTETGETQYRLPESEISHGLALDAVSLSIAARGSLYPDHVIFLGEGSVIAAPGEDVAGVIRRTGFAPACIVFPGAGVLLRGDVPPGADAMARCLADVAARIPAEAPVRVLSAEEHIQLTDWDAEKYRQDLAGKAAGARKSA